MLQRVKQKFSVIWAFWMNSLQNKPSKCQFLYQIHQMVQLCKYCTHLYDSTYHLKRVQQEVAQFILFITFARCNFELPTAKFHGILFSSFSIISHVPTACPPKGWKCVLKLIMDARQQNGREHIETSRQNILYIGVCNQ